MCIYIYVCMYMYMHTCNTCSPTLVSLSVSLCQLCYVSSEEYGRILVQGEENMKRIEEDGRLVAVLEKRAISAQREGYFIVQVCSMCVCVLSPQVIRVQMYSVHVHVHVVYMYIECTCIYMYVCLLH